MNNEEIQRYINTHSGSLHPDHFDKETFWKGWPLDYPVNLAKEVLLLREKLAITAEALEEITKKKDMTMLDDCCVDRTCRPHTDQGGCTHQWGVVRGHNACAYIAQEALKKIRGWNE